MKKEGGKRDRTKVQEWSLALLSLGLGTCVWQFCGKEEHFRGVNPSSVLYPWSLEHMELQREPHSLGRGEPVHCISTCLTALCVWTVSLLYLRVLYPLIKILNPSISTISSLFLNSLV